jgi:3-hydroxyacyl-[acyl-carrier-protein] dehydratase
VDLADIKSWLPHRYPILLVDRVDEVEPGQWLVARKAITANEPCYAGLPDDADQAYPASLLIESWCQAAGVLVMHGEPNPDVRTGQVPLFGAITDLELAAPVRPGDVVRHRVRAQKILSTAALLEGESMVDGRCVMRVGQIVVALRPVSELRLPDPAPAGRAGSA